MLGFEGFSGFIPEGQKKLKYLAETSGFWSFGIELKSLILAQIERWRHALHMQVER